ARRLDQEGRVWPTLSPDGKRVAMRFKDWKHLRVQEAAGGREVFRTSARVDFGELVFSGDGRFLACTPRDDVLRVWEAATGKLLRRLRLRPGDVRSLLLSADGKTNVFDSWIDNALHAWDLEKKRPLRTFPGYRNGPLLVALSVAGTEVVTTNLTGTSS